MPWILALPMLLRSKNDSKYLLMSVELLRDYDSAYVR